MIKLTREELLKVAHLSALKLNEDEIELFEDQIGKILNFADQLQQVAMTTEVEPIRNKNIFREDVIKKCDTNDVLDQAPQREGRYFVVPKILD